VLALSAYDKEEYMRGMLAVGAVGYVLKDKPPETILAAVRAAAQRTRLWTTEQVARALRWQEEVQERWEHLTEREREVLLLVVAGRSNREITREMGISEKTVEYHVTDIWGKLNVDSRSKAIAWLKDSGLGFGTSEPREIPR
jgi:DNA-binding NarL/FixJ family response regulator